MWWNKNKDEPKSESQVLDAQDAHDLATKQLVIKWDKFIEDKIDSINRDIKRAVADGNLETNICLIKSYEINEYQLDMAKFSEYILKHLLDKGYSASIDYQEYGDIMLERYWKLKVSW